MEDFGVKMLEIFRILLASSALSAGAQVHTLFFFLSFFICKTSCLLLNIILW